MTIPKWVSTFGVERIMKYFIFLLFGFFIAVSVPAWAQDAKTAEDFIRNAYAKYEVGSLGPNIFGENAKNFFDPELVSLINRAGALSGGEENGWNESDPLCDCQDSDGLAIQKVSVRMVAPRNAVADVTLMFSHAPLSANKAFVRLNLSFVNGVWRISDILDSDIDHPEARKVSFKWLVNSAIKSGPNTNITK